MSYDLSHTVNRQIGYTVKEIATPKAQFDYWTPESDKSALIQLAESEGYTYFPVRDDSNGLIKGVMTVESLKSGEEEIHPLTSDWLIASDTPILHLLELFAEDPNRNYFVLSSSQILGMVSPADLNRIPARASFYLLVAHFETLLTDLIREGVGDSVELLSQFLSDKRLKRARRIRNFERNEDLEMPIIHYVQLTDLVEILANKVCLYESLGFKNSDEVSKIFDFKQTRNPVAHLNNLLIKRKADIPKINEQCTHIIKYSEKINQLLQNS